MPTLEQLAEDARACVRCALAKGRTQVVFGVGDSAADLMFIGEAPGLHEDKQGIPFVGAAGQLLDEVLRGVGLSREQVYIANVIKCRPPGNRNPLPEEIDACSPYLLQQIDLIDPVVICTLGNFATQLLLQQKVGITRVRGNRFTYRERTLVPTFHPAAVLRGGRGSDQFHQLEQDIKLVRTILDERPPIEGDDSEQLGLF